jgi:hypothetical protein
MGIVRFALKFPYTFYVLAALSVRERGSASRPTASTRKRADVVNAALLVKRRHRFSSNYLAA